MLSLKSFAQLNLVPNSSFEHFTKCPCSVAKLTSAYPWFATCNNPYYNFRNFFKMEKSFFNLFDISGQNQTAGQADADVFSLEEQ